MTSQAEGELCPHRQPRPRALQSADARIWFDSRKGALARVAQLVSNKHPMRANEGPCSTPPQISRPRARLVPIHSTACFLLPTPHLSPYYFPPMTIEPCTMDNIRSGVEAHSTTTAALNADIEALTAAKHSIEIASLKVAFGSVIDILGLIRV